MKNLIIKEIRLATHPTNILFLLLSSMLLIPNYPYYVVFFYTTLGIFFMCLNGRENHDIEYSLQLPVRKTQLVYARILYSTILEVLQFVIAIPFAILRAKLIPAGNDVGMDANIALFGLSLLMMGLFNALFFPRYYQDPSKIGGAFVMGSVAVFLFISIAETLTHTAPFFRNQLDTPDPAFLSAKLAVLAVGILAFSALTCWAARRSARRFVQLDL